MKISKFLASIITVFCLLTFFFSYSQPAYSFPFSNSQEKAKQEEPIKILVQTNKCINCNFEGYNFKSKSKQINLNKAYIEKCNCYGTDFSNISLNQVNLKNSTLSRAKFINSDATGINLSNCKLDQANLSNANMSEANLNNSNLQFANLQFAILTNTSLVNANLSNANLEKANLLGSNITGAILENTNLKGAIMPDGSTHE